MQRREDQPPLRRQCLTEAIIKNIWVQNVLFLLFISSMTLGAVPLTSIICQHLSPEVAGDFACLGIDQRLSFRSFRFGSQPPAERHSIPNGHGAERDPTVIEQLRIELPQRHSGLGSLLHHPTTMVTITTTCLSKPN